MSRGFQQTLERIRADAQSQSQKGAMFERLMRAYFGQDPVYKQRFSRVWLWAEWDFERDGKDLHCAAHRQAIAGAQERSMRYRSE